MHAEPNQVPGLNTSAQQNGGTQNSLKSWYYWGYGSECNCFDWYFFSFGTMRVYLLEEDSEENPYVEF